MDEKTKQSHKEKDENFGLPQEEFEPLKSEGEKWFKITVIIIVLILGVGASIVYWFLYHVPAKHLPSKARPVHKELGNKMPDANVQFKDQDVPTIHQATQKNSQVSKLVEKLDKLAVAGRKGTRELNRFHTDVIPQGTITKITAPQGCYYVVVGSFTDSDLASDYANRLAQQGVHPIPIVPPQGQYFFRVAVEKSGTFYSTKGNEEALRAKYTEDV